MLTAFPQHSRFVAIPQTIYVWGESGVSIFALSIVEFNIYANRRPNFSLIFKLQASCFFCKFRPADAGDNARIGYQDQIKKSAH